jgi:hypothetical protein
MKTRSVVFSLLAVVLATLGYFISGIVIAIYAGLWLHNEKMYYAQGIPAQLFGAAGAMAGLLVACGIWRLFTRAAQ